MLHARLDGSLEVVALDVAIEKGAKVCVCAHEISSLLVPIGGHQALDQLFFHRTELLLAQLPLRSHCKGHVYVKVS
jgi:hypothetical protein